MSVKAKCDSCNRLIDVRAMWKHREVCGTGSGTVRAANRRSARHVRPEEGDLAGAGALYVAMEAEMARLSEEIVERQGRIDVIRRMLGDLKGV